MAGYRKNSAPVTVSNAQPDEINVPGTKGNNNTNSVQAVLDAYVASGFARIRTNVAAGLNTVDGAVTLYKSSALTGPAGEAARYAAASGLAYDLFTVQDQSLLRSIAVRKSGASSGGSAGYFAVNANGAYMPTLEDLDIQDWAGDGIDLRGSVHPFVRNVRMANIGGDGVLFGPTVGTLQDVAASNGTGNGIVLELGASNADASGALVGCSTDNNGGHGVYIKGGKWEFVDFYGEGNTGDLVHVDGTLSNATSATVAAAASAGATTVTVNALSARVPQDTLLTLPSGEKVRVTVTAAAGATSLTVTALPSALAISDTLTQAAADLPAWAIPFVHLKSGRFDGKLYFKACRVKIEGAAYCKDMEMDPSAVLVGEPWYAPRSGYTQKMIGTGGSYALAAALGFLEPINPLECYHLVGSEPYKLSPYNANAAEKYAGASAPSTPTEGFIECSTQYSGAVTQPGWDLGALPVGDYQIRVLVKEPTNTTNALNVQTAAGLGTAASTSLTTATAGWEWHSVAYTQTAAKKSTGGTVQVRQWVAGVTVSVAAVLIQPQAATF